MMVTIYKLYPRMAATDSEFPINLIGPKIATKGTTDIPDTSGYSITIHTDTIYIYIYIYIYKTDFKICGVSLEI
jgi:hypothetical protein